MPGHSNGVSGLSSINTNVGTLLNSMPNTQALLQREWNNSAASVFTDPFNLQDSDPLAYVDWGNAAGPVGFNQGAADPVNDQAITSYNPSTARKRAANRITTTSDVSMPDFGMSGVNTPTTISEVMGYSMANMEESETNSQDLKVPTNTPTTMGFLEDLGTDANRFGTPESMSASIDTFSSLTVSSQETFRNFVPAANTNMEYPLDGNASSNEFFDTNNHISEELANSLTHSLLNQPLPLPVSAANIPLPASEVRSRKESKATIYSDSHEGTPTVEHVNMRNLSQSRISSFGKDENKSQSGNNSPPTTRVFSDLFARRSASAGEFGHDLTNITNFAELSTSATSACISTADSGVSSNPGSAKDAKRPRHFTPASSKAIDDADEPRRGSPRVRLFDEETN